MSDGQAYDEQGLPWLEAVDDEDGPRGVSARKMLAALLVVLLAIGIVAATLFWIGRRDAALSAGGAPELIRAEPGPYKVKPDEPGGLDVAGDSGTAFATGAGEDRDAEIDLDAVAEAPIARPSPSPPRRRRHCRATKPRKPSRPMHPPRRKARAVRAAPSSSASMTTRPRPRRRGPRSRPAFRLSRR